MKHVSLIVPKGHFSLVNIEGTHQILNWVNDYLQGSGSSPVFDVHLVGLSSDVTQTNGLYTIHPDLLIGEVDQTDLIILPAIHGDVNENLNNNADLVPWLLDHYQRGAEVASLCIGSLFLAAIGMLDGKSCSTHWQFANDFRRWFPKAHLEDEKVITESAGIYTSGGAYSFTNLLIYLIEKHVGREVAVATSKAFMIDIDKNSQLPFSMFIGQKTHEDEVVLAAQAYIEEHFFKKISIDQLCERLAVGRRTFERRFKRSTSNTVVEYIQRVRIEAAKKLMESRLKTVSEVMFDVGYSDTKSFRDVFKKITGITPVEYRNKFSRDTILST